MSEKKRILVYNDTLFLVSETFAYHQVESLSKEYDVELLAGNFVNPHGFDIDKFSKHQLDRPDGYVDKVFSKLIRYYFKSDLELDLKSFVKLIKLMRSKRFSYIHAHFGHRALKLLNFAKYFNIPLVVSFHGYDASQLLNDEKYRSNLPGLFNYASAITISGRHMYDNLQLYQWDQKVHFVPYGVNPEELKIKSKEPKDNKIVILHSGRIVNKKGVPDLIRVFNDLKKEYDQIELRIVGEGNELKVCRELVKNLELEDCVEFYGAIPHQKVIDMLNQSDIFVLNSRIAENGDMEGTPVTILEAMCLKKAVVSTYHAGIPYVIEHGKNGLLANERDNEELKMNLEIMINDSNIREELGGEARNTILNSYSTHNMDKKLLDIFNNLSEKQEKSFEKAALKEQEVVKF